ncbi:MAG: hypothetical protein KBC83_03490 [Candidatus Moranbacteria bacterium]|nr:hypothetical protein [Candidatus Moranbacteria bacterium]MBP9801700.1 hypothetical protein [Candidatus Moranbacteria bacterium]
MRQFLTLNGILFTIFAFLSFLPHEGALLTRLIFSISALSIVFLLPGWNTAVIIATIFKKKFSSLEFFTFSIVASFIVPALLLAVEYQYLHILFPSLPIINTLLIFFAATICLQQNKKHSLLFNIPHNPGSFRNLKILSAATFLYLSIMVSMTTAYYPLPDLDPYYWLSQARDFFAKESLPTFLNSRPLFIAFTYLFSIGAQIDLYAYFKYALPLLSVVLIFPAALIAKNFRYPLQKSLAFLFPFTSGIIIIFLGESIPQTIVSILAFFVVAFAIHAYSQKNIFFFFLAGATVLFGYFFHEAFIIPLVSWILTTLYFFHAPIFRLIKKHFLVVILLTIILLPYLTQIGQYCLGISKIFLNSLSNIHPNLLFPQEYVNVDGNQMGWGSLFGVAKYYLFYVGPALLLLLFLLPTIKKHLWKEYLRSPEGVFLSLSFLCFFIIAEVLPRAIGIAFLPDRAWIFSGVFALGFFLPLFKTRIGGNKLVLIFFLLGFSANIGAAIYINTLKKYLIPSEQLASAEWIKTHLPQERIIFTAESSRLLKFFSNSQVVSIKDPNFLFDESVFAEKSETRQDVSITSEKKAAIESLQISVNNLDLESALSDIQKTKKLLEKIEILEEEKQGKEQIQNKKYTHYVYYAAPNKKNPYADRPYMDKKPEREMEMIFNKHPEKFKLLYSDEKNQIFLWEIL